MRDFIFKIKFILPTFLVIVFTSVIGLLLARWFLDIQFQPFDFKEQVWDLWIPMIWPWFPILIWLRPKLRILKYKDSDKGRFGLQMIAWGTMMATLCISQSYLTTASGKLTHLKESKEIHSKEKSRYYKIDHFFLATSYGGAYTDFSTSGKNNQDFNFNVFFVTPILADTNKEISDTPRVWYGTEFHKQVSNRLSNEEKQKQYEAFYSECIDKMNHYNFYDLDHFEREPSSDDKENFLKAIENRIKSNTDESFIILRPVQQSYESRNKNKFGWIFGSFAIGLVAVLFFMLWATVDYSEYRRQLEGKKPKQDDLIYALRFLIPKGEHFATSVILDVNIVVFLVMMFAGVNIISPKSLELLQWGANRRTETINGDWWRLVTCMFLHGGIMHLVANIYGLIIAALFIEPVLGRRNFFILYFLSGIFASVSSICWYDNTISVGASGAIFGLYGAVLSLLLTNAFPKEGRRIILGLIGFYVVLTLLMGLAGGIDNAAHIGGLLSGAIIGPLLYKTTIGKNKGSITPSG